MGFLSEGYSEYIDVTKEKAKSLVYDVLYNGVLSGDISADEYMVIDDDGIYIGGENDFDPDVLCYAIPVNRIVDFSNVSDNSDFIDLSGLDIDMFFQDSERYVYD